MHFYLDLQWCQDALLLMLHSVGRAQFVERPSNVLGLVGSGPRLGILLSLNQCQKWFGQRQRSAFGG